MLASSLATGLYERLIDEDLAAALADHPEIRPILGKLDDEESPHAYSQFLLQLIGQALRDCSPKERLPLVNRVIALVAATDGLDYIQRKTLLAAAEPVLLSLQTPGPAGGIAPPLPRSSTPLATSSLLTGARHDPQLERELRQEMATADRVDILASFVKWSGLRLLEPGSR